jgi:hypothetical protein
MYFELRCPITPGQASRPANAGVYDAHAVGSIVQSWKIFGDALTLDGWVVCWYWVRGFLDSERDVRTVSDVRSKE